VIIVLDPVEADAKLRRGELPCRHCGRPLSPWGWARSRTVPGPGATSVRVRPRRARCRPCAVSEVLLPSQILPRCAASSELVGQVLLAAVRGHGHRRIAADLGLPADTVRRWLRRARANAIWLSKRGAVRAYQLDANLPPIRSAGSALGDAVEALGQAAGAFVRRFGPNPSPWAVIAVLTGGRLLDAPTRPV
jgi:Homeodomain-like domain